MSKVQTLRWYGRLRRRLLSEEPLCRICQGAGYTVAAVELDHIEPVSRRPDLAAEPTNLQPLCRACHEAKTAQENRRRVGATLAGDLI